MKKIKIAIAEDNNSLALAIREKLQLFEEKVELHFHAVNGQDILHQLKKECRDRCHFNGYRNAYNGWHRGNG